jgi:hypothetical protein
LQVRIEWELSCPGSFEEIKKYLINSYTGIFWSDASFYALAIKIDISTAILDFGYEFFVLIDVSSLTG